MILAILQARVSSTRLPGKVLMPILGRPMIELQLERDHRSKKIDKLILATSVSPSDDPLEELCRKNDIHCFRGNLEDVLDRFYQAAVPFSPEYIVRLTGDCPLADSQVIDQVIEDFLEKEYDYSTNGLEPTFPDGLDVEVFRFSALEKAWKESRLPSEREHVTPYIHTRPEIFKIGNYKGVTDLSALRWTVDEKSDFEFVKKVYEELYPRNPAFTTQDILDLLERKPELLRMNSDIRRNEGYQKSLEQDRKIMQNITKSMAMQEKAKSFIPGMTQLLSKRPDLYSYGVWPAYFKKASGVEIWDLDDNRYIDMSIGGIGANVLGYADADVDAAVIDAIKLGTSSSLNCPEEVELAELLCELHPWAKKVRYSRTGGESMAIAVRIARAYTGKDKIAFCGYHGWHDWYLAANIGTENALGEHLIAGLDPKGVPKGLKGTAFPFRYNKLEELKEIIALNKNELAAIVMEPIRNDPPTAEFTEGVRKLANQTGAVLIIDEISSGFRMNTGGAHMKLGINPDIAVFSKALGNGYPIGAIIGKSEIMEAAQGSFISSTYWTERVGPTAAIAMIKKHRSNNAGDHLMKIGTMIQKGWKDCGEKNSLKMDIGGIPPLSHFSFEYPETLSMKALFVQLMLEKGFLAATSFYSMYAHNEEHVDSYLKAVDEVFGKIAEFRKEGTIDKHLIGKPSVSGFKRLN